MHDALYCFGVLAVGKSAQPAALTGTVWPGWLHKGSDCASTLCA